MADLSIESAERISALVDGQLRGAEFTQTVAELEANEEARANWDTCHWLGDVMRSGETQVLRAHDPEFVRRLRQRMQQDVIEIIAVPATEIRSTAKNGSKLTSANDGLWRRVAGFASVALVGVLAWQGMQWPGSADPVGMPQQAQQQAIPVISAASSFALADASSLSTGRALIRSDGSSVLVMSSEPLVMIRDPQLDALLAAHRQFGGASALQTPAGFLRNANFEEGRR
ncbi:MAG: sigma-E factor negative regulatory protein [Rhodoferax sp.]|uniref:sigma-E factor negative regulatory protein n=1 Tax=Rhodoferax sp. TaxID=50421 RepID=UPI002639C225|nr:sigma-E factor negative regulatory protein [Rhodoferax sp.]MDD2879862.1 sigma-E factor negative regulatory protein [Rhodoferax sp.]